jgi:hypothetical protein
LKTLQTRTQGYDHVQAYSVVTYNFFWYKAYHFLGSSVLYYVICVSYASYVQSNLLGLTNSKTHPVVCHYIPMKLAKPR